MNSIPLKTVTVDEIASQVEELATESDKHNTHTRGKQPYLTTFKSIDEGVEGLLKMVDEEAVKETLVSSCGYYLAKASELRVQRQVIVEGLKKWTVGALGLSNPPHISEAFLAKLGVSTEKSYMFGSRSAPYPGSSKNRTTPRWTDRGNQRGRDGRSGQHEGRRFSRDLDQRDSQDRDNYRKRTRSFADRRA